MELNIDEGVDSIAEGMGWESENEGDIEEVNEEVNERDELYNPDDEDEESEASEDEESEADEDPTEESKEIPENVPPASWAKQYHETWNKLPADAQEYIKLREKQMLDGIEQYKNGAAYAQNIRNILNPHMEALQQHGLSETAVIENVLGWNQALTSGSMDQRRQAFIALGTDLGLMPQGEDGAEVDPYIAQLQDRINRMEQIAVQQQQAAYNNQYQQNLRTVEEFANDPAHTHFELVYEDMIPLLNAGLELKDAYDRAVWANPVTRAQEQARLDGERAKKAADERQKTVNAAKNATRANVKTAKINRKTPTEPLGSWDSTMQEILSEIDKR